MTTYRIRRWWDAKDDLERLEAIGYLGIAAVLTFVVAYLLWP